MKRQFQMLPQDESFLLDHGFQYETLVEQNNHWLIIDGWALPSGFNVAEVRLAVSMAHGYPQQQLDMVWVFPSLRLASGRPIGGMASQSIGGHTFQRWSRHRTPANPWRPGIDDLETHLDLANAWFAKEVQVA